MHSTATSVVERILILAKGNGASLPYLDLPVSDLCAEKGRKNSQKHAKLGIRDYRDIS